MMMKRLPIQNNSDSELHEYYQEAVKEIESIFDITLQVCEKWSIKKMLEYCLSISPMMPRTEDGMADLMNYSHTSAIDPIWETELMYLRQYGISVEDYETFQRSSGFKEYFRRVREECLLLR